MIMGTQPRGTGWQQLKMKHGFIFRATKPRGREFLEASPGGTSFQASRLNSCCNKLHWLFYFYFGHVETANTTYYPELAQKKLPKHIIDILKCMSGRVRTNFEITFWHMMCHYNTGHALLHATKHFGGQ
jgi:hypothetical protein